MMQITVSCMIHNLRRLCKCTPTVSSPSYARTHRTHYHNMFDILWRWLLPSVDTFVFTTPFITTISSYAIARIRNIFYPSVGYYRSAMIATCTHFIMKCP